MTFKKSSKFPHPSIKIVSFAAIKYLPLDAYLTHSEQREVWAKKPARWPGWLASRFAAKQAIIELVLVNKLAKTGGAPGVPHQARTPGAPDGGAGADRTRHIICYSPGRIKELLPDMLMTDFAIGHSALGAPQIISYHYQALFARIMISISHTERYGAAVAGLTATGPVGIDIEYIRQFDDATLRAFLTAAEYQLVHHQPPAAQALLATQYWSCKEAYLKAHGVGLRVHPQTVPVALTRATTMHLDKHVIAVVSLGNDRGENGTESARITGVADYRGRRGHTPRGNYVAV